MRKAPLMLGAFFCNETLRRPGAATGIHRQQRREPEAASGREKEGFGGLRVFAPGVEPTTFDKR